MISLQAHVEIWQRYGSYLTGVIGNTGGWAKMLPLEGDLT